MKKPSLYVVAIVLLSSTSCDKAKPSNRHPELGQDHRVVKKGETLYLIAEQEYGDPLAWPLLVEANPWLDPERLQPGQLVYIPPNEKGNRFNVDPYHVSYEHRERLPAPEEEKRSARNSSNEGLNMSNASDIFRNLVPELNGTLFGEPVDKLGLLALGGFFLHAFVQGFLLWIVATVTFVQDVTLKKAMRAAFQAEITTVFSIIILGGVVVLMVHIGTTAPGAQGDTDLLATLEAYLRHPVTPLAAGFVIFGLYMLLCMRFVPSVFGIQRAQSMLLVFVAVLLPHLVSFYTVGQRLGLIEI